MLRFIIGGIAHETNTFNTSPTGLKAFQVYRGPDLLKDDGVKILLESGIGIVPTIYAVAPPSGLVKKDSYTTLKDELLTRIEAARRFDGVCLFLHGAMEVEDIGDGGVDLVNSVRQAVGEGIPIAVSLDLHGNITPELAKSANILTAYRTAPHIDVTETKGRSASLLAKCIMNRIEPVSVIVKLPMLLPGEMAVTSIEPALSLYKKVREVSQSKCALDASLLVGMAWADSPSAGASVIVVAEGRECLHEACEKACSLAKDYWGRRGEFCLDAPSGSVDEAIRTAESCPEKPVFISDSGDNVTGGAAGDVPLLVERLISLNAKDAVVAGIIDPEAVDRCREVGIGRSLSVEIGGKLDRVNGYPLKIKGKVVNLAAEGAVIGTNGVEVILTADWQAFTTLESFHSYGINPLDRKIVVVKQGYLFPELRKVATSSLMALSPGFTDLRIDQLDYKRVRRPIYPLDKDFAWEPSSLRA